MNPFARDVNQILQSKAFARYVDKTQVAYLVENDHITQRSLHVQFVSRLSRELALSLGLDVDLAEAISLGHDVGHPPFGHEGEGYLSDLSIEYGNGPFLHPCQSCRLLTNIEPLNLQVEVRDGFLCHDGGMSEPIYRPKKRISEEEHLREIEEKKENPDKNFFPMTVEGCLVKLSDTVSYLARDLEDGIQLKLVTRDEIPETCLGKSSHSLLERVRQDVLKLSKPGEYIALSDEVFDALKKIRAFNFEKIYYHPKLKRESIKVKRAYRELFEHLLEQYRQEGEKSLLWQRFLKNKNKEYIKNSSDVQLVVDYIAGMTDKYFIRELQYFLVPTTIHLE